MAELRCGRYFVLEGEIEGLFGWIDDKIAKDWAVYFYGMCPIKEMPILSAVFEDPIELHQFEREFLNNQVNQSLVYTGRRSAKFEWPSSEERRGNPERRRILLRRNDGRDGGRRQIDSADNARDSGIGQMMTPAPA